MSGKDVICPICQQLIWIEKSDDEIALCGDDVHITYKQLDGWYLMDKSGCESLEKKKHSIPIPKRFQS